jgi:Trypsin-like peptidase domain
MILEQIISERIAQATLEKVVFDQGLVGEPRRAALFKASGLTREEIARNIVAEYGGQAPRLAQGLYKQISGSDWKTAGLLYEHFKDNPQLLDNHQQASLVARNPSLPMEELNEFLDLVMRQVCLIVSRLGDGGALVCGTGFLVGPDLVLTCRHVLKNLSPAADPYADGNRVEIYFDFLHGEPVDRLSPNLPGAKLVTLDHAWHVASYPDAVPDGLTGELSAEEIARIKSSLDFVLLRLETSVGLQSINTAGGPRRGWVQMPPDDVPQNLQIDDWIIIPQHPDGYSLRVDFGRFNEHDQTHTRIRYRVNTANGTSGAPCFNQKFKLVGIHNAYVGPREQPIENQAIRFDHIAAAVRQIVQQAANVAPYTLRWSVSRSDEPPRVILGREVLLQWLSESATPNPRHMADRVYVAHAVVPSAGCSFSIELLHAEIRGTKTPRAVYGERGQQLPNTPEDFLRSLIRELGMDVKQVETEDSMPSRPNAGSTGEMVGEIDKLERWLSDELPEWLGNVIVKHLDKKVDSRDAARHALQYFEQRGEKPPDLVKQAEATTPILVRANTWDFAYVVIGDLRVDGYQGTGARSELKGELRSLIAGLVRNKSEQTLHPGLRRMRWMFLGYLPDFISAASVADKNGATLEMLDPNTIGKTEVAAVVDRILQALLPKKAFPKEMARLQAAPIVRFVDQTTTAESRLFALQKEANNFSLDVLAEVGS